MSDDTADERRTEPDADETVWLGDRAHCRYGDKGDTGLFVLVPYDPADFPALVASVTPDQVGRHMGGVPADRVRCVPCPKLGAMIVVVRNSLGGGVTASLALDAHGKTLSGHLLSMRLPWSVPRANPGAATNVSRPGVAPSTTRGHR